MEEAKNPTLKLTIDKGPRQGETLESRPELSSIRIGRVIRGNTFTIKDPAISQKHLEIVLTAGKWTVSDLDTSNGTFLNDIKLQPLSPSSLSDGDTIKIGQSTSISVRIDGRSDPGPDPLENQQQRNKRRRGRQCKGRANSEDDLVRPESGPVEKVLERSNLGLGAAITNDVGEKSDLGNVPMENGLQRKPRRRAAPHKARIVSKDDPVLLESVTEKSNLGLDTSITVKVEEKSDLENAPVENGLRRNPRRRAAPNKGRITSEDELTQLESVPVKKVPEMVNLGLDTIKIGETASIPVQVEGQNDSENAPVESRLQRNQRHRAALNRARVSSKDNMVPSESVPVKKVAETSDRVREDTTAIEENSAVPKESEKITLGEWFDRMERYLPKQINDITEEIIQSLRQRHKQFEEFIEQQRDGKGKLAVAN
ncbi:FHA domain-containing protein At4g14490-like [Magnolia sinica]|uniref:FHA domain-containing protein At4g14490-like n=1 Tax=Magnolia sinica TaxID=86752 RepID=UPI0026594FF6|nr:FHA domain-containing protein At4g14490-like [Magnolia sinica]